MKVFLINFFISLVLFLVISPINGLSFGVHSLVAFVINFVFVLLMYRLKINKESKNLMLASI